MKTAPKSRSEIAGCCIRMTLILGGGFLTLALTVWYVSGLVLPCSETDASKAPYETMLYDLSLLYDYSDADQQILAATVVMPSYSPDWAIVVWEDDDKEATVDYLYSEQTNIMAHVYSREDRPSEGMVTPDNNVERQSNTLDEDEALKIGKSWSGAISGWSSSWLGFGGLGGTSYRFYDSEGNCGWAWSPVGPTEAGILVHMTENLREEATGETDFPERY